MASANAGIVDSLSNPILKQHCHLWFLNPNGAEGTSQVVVIGLAPPVATARKQKPNESGVGEQREVGRASSAPRGMKIPISAGTGIARIAKGLNVLAKVTKRIQFSVQV